VVGAIALLDLAGVEVPAAAYVAAALATVGAGLVLGAWYGRARGLIAIGIILSLMLGSVSARDHFHPDFSGGGSVTWVPSSVDEIKSSYKHDVGDAVLDLSRVDFTDRTVTVETDVNMGNMEIILPADVDTVVHVGVHFGEADVFNQNWGGINTGGQTAADNGENGPGGGTLTIDATVNFGNLEVHR
jgi:predicted membrane protein